MANSFNIQTCIDRGCNKVAINHSMIFAGRQICLRKCVAYKAPAILSWHRQGKQCPLGPWKADAATKTKIRLGQQKQKKHK